MTVGSTPPPQPEGGDLGPSAPGVRQAVVLALLLLVPWLLAGLRAEPPAPRARTAPATAFSAGRALDDLRFLLGEDPAPHPAGTAEAAAVRSRLIELLGASGLRLEEAPRFAAGGRGAGHVHNLVLEIPGASEERVLVMAHTDSVGAGPGVADDLAGVAAVVEAVRARLAQGPLERSLLVVFTDAEEDGLHGAAAFARQDPRFDDVVCVLNLEARGCRGASIMFQVGPRSGDLVRRWAARTRVPFADSISEAAYARMPNDTDFSITRDLGRPGLNFAFLEGVEVYHTPLDDLDHLDPASLQHQGEHLLAGMEAADVARFDEATRPVWLTLLGTTFVLPGSSTLALALLSLGLAVVGVARRLRLGELNTPELTAALVRTGPLLLLPVLLTLAVGTLLARLSGEPTWGRLNPGPAVAATCGAVAWALAGVAPRHVGRASRVALVAGAVLLLCLLACVLGLWEPRVGATLQPAATVGALALLLAPTPGRSGRSALPLAVGIGTSLALLHGAPLIELFTHAFGGTAPQVPVAVGCVLAGPLLLQLLHLGRMARRSIAGSGAVLVAAVLALAAGTPAGSPRRPVQDSVVLDWSAEEGLRRREDAVALEGVELEALAPRIEVLAEEPRIDGTRWVVRISNGGPWGTLRLEGPDGAQLEGRPLEPEALDRLRLFGMGPEGLVLDFLAPVEGGARLRVRLETPLCSLDLGGLDPEELRAPNAVPSYRGDRLRAHAERTFGEWEVAAEEEGVEVPDSDGDGTGLSADEEDHGH